MPYTNVSPAQQGKMDKCVNDVMKTGKDKKAAIAICYSSIVGKDARELKHIFHYKAITDAPNLRGHGQQSCANCQFFSWLPVGEISDTAIIADAIPAKGVCSQYEFETDAGWVCDSWETWPTPEVAKQFTVFKQKDGAYRWVVISSNSYRDRDREIVSQKALEADVERMDATGVYGPLRWWHVGQPDIANKQPGPGLDIGDCDFAAMHGRMLVESGTFRDQGIAAKLAEHAGELQVSRAFFHPLDEPDSEGTFYHIQGFERSLLPAGKAANVFTSFLVAKEEPMATTLRDKIESWLKIGGDKETADKIMQEAEALEASAKAAGIAAKAEPAVTPATEPVAPAAKEEPPAPAAPTAEEIAKQAAALVLAQLTPVLDGLKAQTESAGTATKEAQGQLAAQLAQVSQAQAQLAKRIDDLDSLQPRAFRASREDSTKIGDTSTVKDKAPGPDPKSNGFYEFVTGQAPTAK